MTILITGITGTVGSNLGLGIGFFSKEYDLRNKEQTQSLLAKIKPKAIIHCASKVGGLDEHLRYKKKLFIDNVLININILEAAQEYGVPRVLSFLSSCIYSDDAKQPYNEQDIHTGPPFVDYYPYGYSKRLLEVQSRIYYEEYGLSYNCVIPTNIYGINDDFNLLTGHVVGVLIHKAYLANKNNTNFEIWGDGKQERQFLFTNDVRHLTHWVLENYTDKEPLVLANDQVVTIGEVANIIADKMKIKNKLVFQKDKPEGQKKRILDNSKLKSLYDYKFIDIEKGISNTVDWFLENYNTARR